MKKFLCMLTVCLLICVLAACTQSAPTTGSPSSTASSSSSVPPSSSTVPQPSEPQAHTCDSLGIWQFDLNNHWQICEHGTVNQGAHNLADNCCTECSVYFSDLDGWTLINMFNEHMDMVLGLSYDENGKLMYKDEYAYTYHENDMMAISIYHENDILCQEMRFDDHGNQTHWFEFNPDGSFKKHEVSEFTYDNGGRVIGQKRYEFEVLKMELEYIFIATKKELAKQITYSEDGTKTATHYSYDSNGDPAESFTYVNDVLTVKYEYAATLLEGDAGYDVNVISAIRKYTYEPDGSYTLLDYTTPKNGYTVTTHDATGKELTRECYDANGNLLPKPESFDEEACAPLFGVWEYTSTMNSLDLGLPTDIGISVQMTVRMTFDSYGVLTMQMVANQQDYYFFMLQVTAERLLLQLQEQGMTRAEARSYYLHKGTTVEDEAAKQLGSAEELLPEDATFTYYVKDGKLYYFQGDQLIQIRITVTDSTLTLHGEDGSEDTVLTKKN